MVLRQFQGIGPKGKERGKVEVKRKFKSLSRKRHISKQDQRGLRNECFERCFGICDLLSWLRTVVWVDFLGLKC